MQQEYENLPRKKQLSKRIETNMVTHTCIPSTWDTEAGDHKFDAIQGYIESTRPAWTTEQCHISKIHK
jgi:hypothetical protein